MKWAFLKGAKRVIAIDKVKSRLERAVRDCNAEALDFTEYTDVPKRIFEMVGDRGLDVAIDCGTFHEPKTIAHKVQKTLMLETDVPEIVNECIVSVKKGGSVGVIAA